MAEGTPLPTTDQKASLADKTVQDLVSDLVPLAETAAIAAQPWLATPVLKQLWQSAFRWLMGLVGTASGLVTGYIVIDVQKYARLHTAAKALSELQAAKQKGDPNAINAADQAADDAAADVLHYVGSVQPH